ncbi:SCO family protein [Xanthomonas albilineans]|uniref:SCO family protein n=1 Tax=Xanthomonas albilineans TaxID=29447 RepID=UPI0005F34723|nr:SCO family protein [Xanthomonas albilineans]PPU92583.1 SCO family protein [Xanthomonas albilineans]
MFNRTFGIVLVVALAAGLGLLLAQRFFIGSPVPAWPETRTVRLYPQPRALPDVHLRQSDGSALTPSALKGHWTLVFLGFTACPDVCPTTLATLARAQAQWQTIPDNLRPRVLFVSVDPQRDTLARLGQYVRAFHKDTLAATADMPELERFATALGFVFQKVPGTHFAQNPNDYSMDHSAAIAVLDPQGRQAGLIRPPFDAAAIAADLQALTKTTTP